MQRKAFSLIELMIVIVILGLLAAMVVPNLTGKAEEAKKKIVCVEMKRIYNGVLDEYKVNNSTYPSTEEGLELLAEKDYFKDKKLPHDSWGSKFIYINDDGSIEIISFGADKKEGGEESAADIKMSECK